MHYEFFDLTPEQTDIVLIGRATVFLAQRQITSCEECNPEAEVPFDLVIDHLTGRLGSLVEYVLERPATCLRCGAQITEKTLVEWDCC